MKKWLKTAALIIVIAGAVNWGLIGLFEFDLLGKLLSGWLLRGLQILVGVAGGIAAFSAFGR